MEPLLKHVHASLRGSGGNAAAFDCAAAQLQLLGASGERQAGAADLAEELLERIEQLVGSKQASQRLLGLQLLRSAIAHCHRRTFLTQHPQWAALLLTALRGEQQRGQKQQKEQGEGQQPSQQQLQTPSAAAVEACTCLAAYFSRVGRMLEVPGVRRDGAAAASKLAALLLQQGQQGAGAAPLLALPQGQQALLAALTALPASFRQQQKALEQALLPLLMQAGAGARAGAGATGSSCLLAACAAALPRASGDGSSWSAFCQRLLLTAHKLADALLLQLDDAQLAAAGRGALDPAAEPLPDAASAGRGASLSTEAYTAGFGQLGAVLQTLQQLLSASYPAPVPVPAGGLLLLASRLLSVDDSAGAGSGSGKAASAAAASARFPLLCLELPALQAAALHLLQRLLAACGSAAAPYFVAAARLLAEALQRSAAEGVGAMSQSAQVRCQLYAAARQLLLTAGVGAVRHLAPALLPAAAAELYGRKGQDAGRAGGGEEDGPARKKARKNKQAAAGAGGMPDSDSFAAGTPLDDLGSAVQLRNMAVQALALQALQALSTAGGALLSAQQRRQLDDLAAHVAGTSAAAACQLSSDAESAVSASLAALQLSAYQLLLATLLSPAAHRPQHLAAALQLFRAGSAGGAAGAAALAHFCRQALLSCEVLLHPRCLPPPAAVRLVSPPAADGDQGGVEPARLGMPRFWCSVDATLLLEQEQVHLAAQQQAQQAQRAAARDDRRDVEMEEEEEEAAAEEEQAPAHVAAQGQGQEQPALQQPLPALRPAAFAAPAGGASAGMLWGAAQEATQPKLPPPPPQQQQPKVPAVSRVAAMLAGQPAPSLAPSAPAAAAAPQAETDLPRTSAPLVSAQPPQAAPSAPAFAAVPPQQPAAGHPAAAAGAAAVSAALAAAAAEESDSEGSLPDIDSGESSSSDSESEGEEES